MLILSVSFCYNLRVDRKKERWYESSKSAFELIRTNINLDESVVAVGNAVNCILVTDHRNMECSHVLKPHYHKQQTCREHTFKHDIFWGNFSSRSPHLPVETLCINYELDLDRSQPKTATRKKDGQQGKTKAASHPQSGIKWIEIYAKGCDLGGRWVTVCWIVKENYKKATETMLKKLNK